LPEKSSQVSAPQQSKKLCLTSSFESNNFVFKKQQNVDFRSTGDLKDTFFTKKQLTVDFTRIGFPRDAHFT